MRPRRGEGRDSPSNEHAERADVEIVSEQISLCNRIWRGVRVVYKIAGSDFGHAKAWPRRGEGMDSPSNEHAQRADAEIVSW